MLTAGLSSEELEMVQFIVRRGPHISAGRRIHILFEVYMDDTRGCGPEQVTELHAEGDFNTWNDYFTSSARRIAL